MQLLGILFSTLFLLFALPDVAWAWGPATHIYLGAGVLESLHLLPESMRMLISCYPYDFLYGSVAADISLAKKYVPEGRHCHHWHVGEEIYESADTDRLRAVGLGYLSHLAADTIAHNFYVPRKILLASAAGGLGHSYWEHRMDVTLGERWTGVARHVVMRHDNSAADALFDRVLSSTLFSFKTNRHIFRGMIRFQDNDRWQGIFNNILRKARVPLSSETIDAYVRRSFDYIIDYLNHREEAIAARLDPIGEENLHLSTVVRRMALKEGTSDRPRILREMADSFFPLPEIPFGYWRAPGEAVRKSLPVMGEGLK